MNTRGLWTLYAKEVRRTKSVIIQAVIAPLLSNILYFAVFGGVIGASVGMIDGVSFGVFLIPGILVMTIVMNALMASSSAMYFPRFLGTMADLLAAPLSFFEIVAAFVGSAVTRSLIIAAVVFLCGMWFFPFPIAHPVATVLILTAIATAFALVGVMIGIAAKDFEGLSLVPTLILTPLTFLGGIFYSITQLPAWWQTLTLWNPIFLIVDTARWAMIGQSTLAPIYGLGALLLLISLPTGVLVLIFRTGWRIQN